MPLAKSCKESSVILITSQREQTKIVVAGNVYRS